MSYRFRLLVLVIGVSVLPLIFTVFVFYLRGVNTQKAGRPGDRFLQMMNWIEEELPERWKNGSLEEARRTLPKGEEVAVLDSTGRIVFTTLPELQAGEQPGKEKLFRVLLDTQGFRSMVIPVIVDREAVGAVIQRIPHPPDPVSRFALWLEGPVVYLSFVVIAAAILIGMVTRSLRRGIDRLEKATARVANGDLEFELKPEGRNELATLTRAFESMRRALKEEQAMRSRFLMAVSHDLKTPLTVIRGYLEAIQDGVADNPDMLRSHMAIVSDRSLVLENRINELIEYVKMSTGQWQLRHRPINIHRFFSGLVKVFAADAQVFRRSFGFNIELPKELELAGDEELLTRALDNLFHNALRYTREGDTIRLLARQVNGEVEIVFEDTGPGVAPDELEKIFEPLYRGTNSRRETGSGLGLSTVRSILGAHGWSIRAASPPGQGLRFLIRAGKAAYRKDSGSSPAAS